MLRHGRNTPTSEASFIVGAAHPWECSAMLLSSMRGPRPPQAVAQSVDLKGFHRNHILASRG
eukprot:scaffold115_cov304-Prasinococcus_capsulatus_cf.AAC.23